MRHIPILDKVKCENKNKNTTYITELTKYGFLKPVMFTRFTPVQKNKPGSQRVKYVSRKLVKQKIIFKMKSAMV